MIQVITYQCEVCGTLYDDREKCGECEICHVPVINDQPPFYKYYPKEMGPESKYPYAVIVKMDDGETLTFKR